MVILTKLQTQTTAAMTDTSTYKGLYEIRLQKHLFLKKHFNASNWQTKMVTWQSKTLILSRLCCQQINHQIVLKFLNMMSLAITYHFVKKKNIYFSFEYFAIYFYRALLLKEVNIV